MFLVTRVPVAFTLCTKTIAVLLACVLTAGLCLAVDTPVSDDAIYDRVRIKLASDPEVKASDLHVDVKLGVVTLSGTAYNSRMKSKAAKVAKRVKGVKQVINNVEIGKRG